ncbi:MAG TPA: NTP transferase domain-containing protein [Acholeplasma sp.]|nr:NTP transferase domain-containing protein [Acholeplasma sp.]
MLVAVVLASGRGTRLRPLSTDERPKQFLDIISGKSLVEDTIDRVKNIVDNDNIFVVINEKQENLARNLLNFLPEENLIVEPHMKETLASMSHSVSYISKIKGDDVTYLFLPSDHYIKEIDLFEVSIKEGLDLFNKYNNFVLYGLPPTDPNPNYGYIKTTNLDNDHLITDFIEKPKLEIAEKIYNKDNYFWNNAIMLANKELIYNAIKSVLPTQHELLLNYDSSLITKDEFFNLTHVDNFSRSILEKQSGMMLVKALYTWYDIGSFEVLFHVLELLNKHDEIEKIKELIK